MAGSKQLRMYIFCIIEPEAISEILISKELNTLPDYNL